MARTSNNPVLQLSPREESVQQILGQHHRKIVAQFMREQYDSSIGEGTAGIFLSGGIDSGSMVFSLIEDCGKTIHDAYTAVIESPDPDKEFIESSDYIRAKRICDYYGIRHHAVVIPRNPDYICNRMIEIAEYSLGISALHSRSDFEVMVLYFACAEAAAKNGNSVVFSGLLDGSIHLHSRKLSVPNKKKETLYGHYRMFVETLDNLSIVPGQADVIMQKCKEHNLTIFLSHTAIAAQYPYAYIPWRMLNRPRDKWISIAPYAEEYKKTTGSAYPYTMAMQCGDSGSREFFDEMVARSSVSDDFVKKHTKSKTKPKPVKTSKVFTNALARLSATKLKGETGATDEFPYIPDTIIEQETIDEINRVSHDVELSQHMIKTYGGKSATTEWLEYLTCGGERPSTVMQINEEGRSTLSYFENQKSKRKKSDPFQLEPSVIDREEIFEDSDGNIDSRVDCFGSPLHRGPAYANVDCPRAQAGLCGIPTTEKSDSKPEIHKCTVLDTWGSEVSRNIWEFPASSLESRHNNQEWSASCEETNLLLKSGFGAFIKSQENFFF